MVIINGLQTCNFCDKNIDEGAKFDYKATKCNQCIYAYQREYMKKNEKARKRKQEKDRIRIKNMPANEKLALRDRNKIWRRSIKSRYKRCKRLAKYRKINFDLTIEEFSEISEKHCHYCNNFLSANSETGSNLDRIDNSKGYQKDNIVSCCKICNQIKGANLSIKEAEAAISAVIQIRKSSCIIY